MHHDIKYQGVAHNMFCGSDYFQNKHRLFSIATVKP
jgi:hypothetical protein